MAKVKDLDSLKEVFQSGEYVKFPLNNVILEWPHLYEPDCKFDSVGKFHVNCIISKSQAEDMKYIGFNVKKNVEGQDYVEAKRKPALGRPKVTMEGEDFDPRSIGNGTVATVKCSARYMTVTGKKHLPIYMEEVIVEDLVTYDGGTTDVDPF